MEDVKDRLKEIRRVLNLKQREITEKLEIHITQYSAWETGKESVPRARIYQICKEFNVRREWLETGDGEMFEPKPDARLIGEFSNREIYVEAMERLWESLPDDAKDAIRMFTFKFRPEYRGGIPISEYRPPKQY